MEPEKETPLTKTKNHKSAMILTISDTLEKMQQLKFSYTHNKHIKIWSELGKNNTCKIKV